MKSRIDEVWQKLLTVTALRFSAESRAETITGWAGVGNGTVSVLIQSPTVVLFEEFGELSISGRPKTKFSNTYRWIYAFESIKLEHLRFGPDNPLYLFDLVDDPSKDCLISDNPHVCSEDVYSAVLTVEAEAIRLVWTVVGPKKNEAITYEYR